MTNDKDMAPSLARLARLIVRMFLLLFVARIVVKWIASENIDAWLAWLTDDWLAELAICAFSAVLVSVPAIYGLANNRYVDRASR